MGEDSKIEWTDHTQNFWTGCTKISAGCDSCYAAALASRYVGNFGSWTPGAARKRTGDANWRKPLRWDRMAKEAGKRARVFCSSMADFFDNKAPEEWRAEAWRVIRATPNLDWQLLTKRPQNIARFLPPDWGDGYPNVWLGSTVEDARVADRIGILAAIPASVRFLSVEPLIAPLGWVDLSGIDWVIVGGESGPGARIMQPAWAREVRDLCQTQGVYFFFKQFGSYASNPSCAEWGLTPAEAAAADPPSNGKGGGLLDGKLWREFPRAA